MNAKYLFLVLLTASVIFAQSDQKFQIYGFADMTITKYFPADHSPVRGVNKMDERAMFSFDHLNLYQEYKPNDRVRFLTELSFQDKPPYYKDRIGSVSPFAATVEPKLADTNKTQKGIVNYEWGTFSVERAQMSVNANRYLNFTFGKFITPAGIWNVDHGSPVIMTVNQPSQYTFREIYPKSLLGIMESGTYFIGDADVSYTAYVSSGRGNPVIKNIGELAAGGQLRLGLPVLDACNIGFSGYTGTQTAVFRTQTTEMISTIINPAGDPTDFMNNYSYKFKYSFTDNRLFRYRENVFGLDFLLKKSIVSLQAEFNYQHTINSMRKDWNKDSISTGILGTYVLGSVDAYKSPKFKLTPYGYWELVRYYNTFNNPSLFTDLSSITPEGTAGATQPYLFCGYMKVMAGVNMKILANFGIKAEFNFTRIYERDFMNPKSDPNKPGEDPDGLLDVPGVTTQFYIAF